MRRAPAALLAALAVTGCGGGASADDVRRDAQAACRSARTDLERLQSLIQRNPSNQDLLRQARERGERLVAELDALEPPDDLRERYDAFVAAEREGVRLVADLGDAVAARDLLAVRRLIERTARQAQRLDAAARAAGLPDCRAAT